MAVGGAMVTLWQRAVLAAALLCQVTSASPRGVRQIVLSNATAPNVVPQEKGQAIGELRGARPASAAPGPLAAAAAPVSRPKAGLASVAIEPHKAEAPPKAVSLLKPEKIGSPPAPSASEAEAEAEAAAPERKEVVINPSTGEPVSARNAALSEDKYGIYFAIGVLFIASGLFLWCGFLPYLFIWEWSAYKALHLPSRTFGEFLTYRFNTWMNNEGLAANTKILFGGTISLMTAGAFFYWLITGRSAIEGLWLVFLWASASSVESGTPRASGAVGAVVTVGGLVLLAILLGTMTEFFALQVEAAKEGRDAVVEGGHILVIGQSANTKSLLEELALADPEESMTVVLLDKKPKHEIERQIHDANTQLGNLKLVVRSGRGNAWQDLAKVAADTASRIVIPEDPSCTREESDAANFGTLLTLKGHRWPQNGYVTAQCCLSRNDTLMRDLGPDPTLVLNGERLGRLMVQSARDPGLCQVFSHIIGFDGDEFYSKSAEELGVVGWRFNDIAFSLENAVALGVQDTKTGEYLVNPDQDREVKATDEVILLAEDDDSIGKATAKPFFDVQTWNVGRTSSNFEEENPNDHERATVLVCNFSDRGVGCAILFALDESLAAGSEVDIFTGLSQDDCEHILLNAQKRQGKKLANLQLNINSAPPKSMASLHYLEALRLRSYNHIFVLADTNESYETADQKTVAMIIQLRRLLEEAGQVSGFDPVVEICTKTAEEQLNICNIHNVVNTSLILSRALALVTMKRVSHGVLMDLLSVDGNNFDIQDIKSYLPAGHKLPTELNFAQATAIVTGAAKQILIGWSQELDGTVDYEINPKDKMRLRPWGPNDKLVVIKDV